MENTSSACARLVPPAPSALSNSDLLIAPSPLPSICENRSCNASDGLMLVAVAPDDCPCAASSALMVEGEMPLPGEQPAEPEAVPVEAVVVEVTSNEAVDVWLKPVVANDDFDDDVSD